MSKKTDDRGMTLIELVISIAIMTVLAVTVGSMIVIATKNYKLSTVQTILISEASNTKNQIMNMIMDATDSVAYLSDSENSSEVMIIRNGAIQTLFLNEDENKLYIATDEDELLLAEYVTHFEVDDSDYEDNKTISFKINYEFEGMSYKTAFQATSRNDLEGNIEDLVPDPYFKISPKELYLEPNQDYFLDAKLIGGDDKYDVSVIDSSTYENLNDNKRTTVKGEKNKVKIHIGRNETGNDSATMYLKFESKEHRDGKPVAQAVVTVRIRRVTGIKANLVLMSGEPGKKDSVYEATGFCFGTNLEKVTTNDKNIVVDPKAIFGQFSFYEDGKEVFMFHYFDIIDMNARNARIKFKYDMPDNSELRVKVIAQHPLGAQNNVSRQEYGYFEDVLILKNPNGPLPAIIDNKSFYRGAEFFVKAKSGNDLYADSNILSGLGYEDFNAANANASAKNWIYRFREIKGENEYGDWVPFRMTKEHGLAAKLQAPETLRFEPDKYYELQMVYAALDPVNKVLYYPISDALLKAPGFEGYRAGWNSTQSQMDEEQYVQATIYIPPIELEYENLGFKNLPFIGTIDEPVKYKKFSSMNVLAYTNYLYEKKYLDIVIQTPSKNVQHEWDNYNPGIQIDKSINMDSKTRVSKLQCHSLSQIGKYRALIGLNWPIYDYGNTITDCFEQESSFLKEYRYYKLYDDMDTGKGMFYFDIVE